MDLETYKSERILYFEYLTSTKNTRMYKQIIHMQKKNLYTNITI